MHFDDRLETVLRQPAGRTMERIQYRQLLDLLGTAPAELTGDRIDAAHARFADLGRAIPMRERAAMLADPALRLRNPQLLAQLMADEPAVANAAAARAELTDDQWSDLIPVLPVRLRGLIRQRHDLSTATVALLDWLGVPGRRLAGPPPSSAGAHPASAAAPAAGEPIEEIGAIVRRIEAYRKNRAPVGDKQGADGSGEPPPTGPRATVRRFDFATDIRGTIVWADRACAPSIVGMRLAAEGTESPLQTTPEAIAAFERHQPIRDALASIDGAPSVVGAWHIDAMPRFDQPGGRFAGYIGRVRRAAQGGAAAAAADRADHGADRIRQMLHELRTPVNAIQGFAEVLLYQLYGPTPHEYRAFAAGIAGDSARILAGFDELERLVQLDAEALRLEPGESDLAALVGAAVAQLSAATSPRNSGFLPLLESENLVIAMARVDAERLVWRLLAGLANWTASGEMLKLRLRQRDGEARLTVRLPESLAGLSDDALFDASSPGATQALSAGMFGTGFALRLAAAEARAGGGGLERRGDKLRLTLPVLTPATASHSQSNRAGLSPG